MVGRAKRVHIAEVFCAYDGDRTINIVTTGKLYISWFIP
jgi:hypothetical protein